MTSFLTAHGELKVKENTEFLIYFANSTPKVLPEQ